MENTKNTSLDGVRGLAAVTVIFSHLVLWFYPYLSSGNTKDSGVNDFTQALFNSPFTFIFKGTSAVMLFFIISGYVLSLTFARNGITVDKIQSSACKRYLRLGIPVAVSVIICAILMSVHAFRAKEYGITLPLSSAYTGDLNLMEVIKQALYGSMLFGQGSFNYVLWTISIEFYGSMLVFALWALFGKNQNILRLVCVLISWFTIASGTPFVWGLGLFPIGVLLSTFKFNPSHSAYNKASCFVMLAAGFYLLGFNPQSYSYEAISSLYSSMPDIDISWGFFIPIVGAILTITSVIAFPRNLSLLRSVVPQLLGRISFSLYLLHSMILTIISTHMVKAFGVGVYAFASSLVLTMLITIPLSFIFYKLVDVKATYLSSLFAKRTLEKEKSILESGINNRVA